MKRWLLASMFVILNVGCSERDTGPATTVARDEIFLDAEDDADFMRLQADIDAFSLKRRFVRINAKPLQRIVGDLQVGETAELDVELNANFFEDDTAVIAIEEAEKVAPENFILTGYISGEPGSSVTLVYNEGVVAANVRREGATESYEVRESRDGIHLVNLLRDDDESTCEEVEDLEAEEAVAEDESDVAASAAPVIDILAVYTPNARIKRGRSGIIALIQMGIADTNSALRYSGSTTRVRLVGTMELNRNESGYWSTDLSYLRGKTDGRWDNVHAERSRLGADQVSMVATYPRSGGTAGIGYIRSTLSSAFAITRDSAFNMYTFAHELGHNIGLRHSDGYVSSGGRFRTIMAYGSYPRIRRFSNPYITYRGYRTGSSVDYSVRVIRSRDDIVANLMRTRVFKTSGERVP